MTASSFHQSIYLHGSNQRGEKHNEIRWQYLPQAGNGPFPEVTWEGQSKSK